MTKKFQALGVDVIPAEMEGIYQAALAEFERDGVFFLEESYLRDVQEKCNAFPRTLGRVLS
jgi:hypothetical protein